jgi:hypothetical protein
MPIIILEGSQGVSRTRTMEEGGRVLWAPAVRLSLPSLFLTGVRVCCLMVMIDSRAAPGPAALFLQSGAAFPA